jgi:hypothetical protein
MNELWLLYGRMCMNVVHPATAKGFKAYASIYFISTFPKKNLEIKNIYRGFPSEVPSSAGDPPNRRTAPGQTHLLYYNK